MQDTFVISDHVKIKKPRSVPKGDSSPGFSSLWILWHVNYQSIFPPVNILLSSTLKTDEMGAGVVKLEHDGSGTRIHINPGGRSTAHMGTNNPGQCQDCGAVIPAIVKQVQTV